MRSVGIVISVPDPLAGELQQLRASFGDPMAAVIPAHVTLVTGADIDDWEATRKHVRRAVRGQRPFRISVKGSGTFRPVSPVVFLNVVEGYDECVELHRRLQSGPLAQQPEFEFHPHITVAHDVSDASMDAAQRRTADFEASFNVSSMGLYEHDALGAWRLREELVFGVDQPEQQDPAR